MKIYEVREKDSSLLCARYGKEERKMKFAFLIMGDFHTGTDHAEIRNGDAQIIGVVDLEEAIGVAHRLQEEGIDCIELCGAFGEAGGNRQQDSRRVYHPPAGAGRRISCRFFKITDSLPPA